MTAVDPVAFASLCDIVASDRFFFLTGAGTSAGLQRRRGRTIPCWLDLLTEIRDALRARAGPCVDAATPLLHPDATGPQLIEAATLLKEADPAGFGRAVAERLTPRRRQDAAVVRAKVGLHDAMLDLGPRGIVTMNVDLEHEAHLARRRERWTRVDALGRDSESTLRTLIASDLERRFLLKAHGSLTGPAARVFSRIVFDFDAYRTLIAARPAYRAFMQNLMTNFSFVSVGFGRSDLDFDLFTSTVALDFGAPLRRHVAFDLRVRRRKKETRAAFATRKAREDAREGAKHALHLLRLGIHPLVVDQPADIETVLRDAARTLGPALRRILDACVAPRGDDRSRAHHALRALGPTGKAIASEILRAKIDAAAGSVGDVSEWIYSLGTVDPADEGIRRRNTLALLRAAERSRHPEIAAHALIALERLADTADLPALERVAARLRATRLPRDAAHPDPDDRTPVFAEALILRVRAKRRCFPPRRAVPLFPPRP